MTMSTMLEKSLNTENGTKIFYYAAQTYKGAYFMSTTCKTYKQVWNAFLKADVMLMKKSIAARGGNYARCLAWSQTGYDHIRGFVTSYLKMSVKGMTRYMKELYAWED